MLFRVEDQIHCWLLVEGDCPTFGGAVVSNHLNQVLPGLAFAVFDESEGEYVVLSDSPPEIYVLMSFVQERVDRETLERSLDSPYAKALSPNIEAAIEKHRSYVHITVSNNHPVFHVIAGISDDILGDLREHLHPLETEFQAGLIEGKIVVCQHIASLLAEMLPVAAVHWGQSDLLLCPEVFLRQNAGDFPSLIHVHPFPYLDRNPIAGSCAGFTTLGARHVIGREIDFRPCCADFSWMYERTLGFLGMARKNRHSVIADGESFGADEDEIIRVRHLPQVEGRFPLIVLEVERSIQHGIEPGILPKAKPSVLSPLFGSLLGKRKSD